MKFACTLAALLALSGCVYDLSNIEHSTARVDSLGQPCPSGASRAAPRPERYETPYDKAVRDSASSAGQRTLGCDTPRPNS